MSLRPRSGTPPVPDDTTRVARAAFPCGNPYLLLRDRLGPVVRHGDLADLYPGCARESMQNRGGLVSIATLGCGSPIASLTHRIAFGPSSPRLRARDVPERGAAPTILHALVEHDDGPARLRRGRVLDRDCRRSLPVSRLEP